MQPRFKKDDIVRFTNNIYPEWFNKKFKVLYSDDGKSTLVCLEFINSIYPKGASARTLNLYLELVKEKKPSLQLGLFDEDVL